MDPFRGEGGSRDWVKIRPEFGGGYPATVDGLHHLHCLARLLSFLQRQCSLNIILTLTLQNVIRQTLWWNFEYYKAKGLLVFKDAKGEFDDLVAKYHVCKYISGDNNLESPPRCAQSQRLTEHSELQPLWVRT